MKSVSKGGRKIKDILCTIKPFKTSKCEMKVCPMCFDSKHFERNSQTRQRLGKKRKNSPLFKHIKSEHPNESVKFKMEIMQKYQDALSRQAKEEVRINNRSSTKLLNSKS